MDKKEVKTIFALGLTQEELLRRAERTTDPEETIRATRVKLQEVGPFGPFTDTQRYLTRVYRALQPRSPEIAREEKFLKGIKDRMEPLGLFSQVDWDLVSHAAQVYAQKENELLAAKAKMLHVVEAHMLDGTISVPGLESQKEGIEDMFEPAKILETIYALSIAGAMNAGEPLRLHDICGSHGISSFVACLCRSGNTSATCYDKSKDAPESFLGLSWHAFPDISTVKFSCGDISDKSFPNAENSRNVWFIRSPGSATQIITKKISQLEKSEVPDSIVIIPCTCCFYGLDLYPGDNEAKISQEEWGKLGNIMRIGKGRSHRDTPGRRNVVLAKALMDQVWISHVCKENPHIKGSLHPSPVKTQGYTVIHLAKR